MIRFSFSYKTISGRTIRSVLVGAGILLLSSLTIRPAEAQAYWDPGIGMDIPVAALYFFKPDNTGVRTTYPSGRLEFGQPVGFAYTRDQNGALLIQYPSGYTDIYQLIAYDSQIDTYSVRGYDRSARASDWPWYGCASGQMPTLLVATLC